MEGCGMMYLGNMFRYLAIFQLQGEYSIIWVGRIICVGKVQP